MIAGAHAIIFTPDPERLRAFVRDVLGFSAVDAGAEWFIFALPPAELAVHPAEDPDHHHEPASNPAGVSQLRTDGGDHVLMITTARATLGTQIDSCDSLGQLRATMPRQSRGSEARLWLRSRKRTRCLGRYKRYGTQPAG